MLLKHRANVLVFKLNSGFCSAVQLVTECPVVRGFVVRYSRMLLAQHADVIGNRYPYFVVRPFWSRHSFLPDDVMSSYRTGTPRMGQFQRGPALPR